MSFNYVDVFLKPKIDDDIFNIYGSTIEYVNFFKNKNDINSVQSLSTSTSTHANSE